MPESVADKIVESFWKEEGLAIGSSIHLIAKHTDPLEARIAELEAKLPPPGHWSLRAFETLRSENATFRSALEDVEEYAGLNQVLRQIVTKALLVAKEDGDGWLAMGLAKDGH